MRVISINTNGIRAAARKGFFAWLAKQGADFVCVQETKAQVDQLQDPVFHPESYQCHYFDALKKGYSGTALYSLHKPLQVIRGYGESEFDNEGRYLEYRYKNLSVISLYAPSGSSGDHRQESKFRFMQSFMLHLQALRRKRREFIICGDWNIAHQNIDLKNWRSNQKNSGFLPEERAWLSDLFDRVGFIDGFRQVDQREEQYTWWSNRGQCWANNVGWRIDYQMVKQGMKDKIQKAAIFRRDRFSDNAPLIMVVLFQHDIRRALARVGRGFFPVVSAQQESQIVEEVVRAAQVLARRKVGALMVLERETTLSDQVEIGTRIDCAVTKDLLASIFAPSSPLHDGAALIQDGRIAAVGCILPLTLKADLPEGVGTRHRDAVGITEETDAVVIGVSEETGTISSVYRAIGYAGRGPSDC